MHLLYLLFRRRLLPVPIFLPALTPYEGQACAASRGEALPGRGCLCCADVVAVMCVIGMEHTMRLH